MPKNSTARGDNLAQVQEEHCVKLTDLPFWSKRAADWAEEYHATLRDHVVRAPVTPGFVLEDIPTEPPEAPEGMEQIFEDFEDIIPGAMTHWQHPRFFAYFPANSSPASMLAEQLATAMSAQCMLWQTSPAATELEIAMIRWLAQALGLPAGMQGVIQDSATSATLSAVLTMRERALGWKGLDEGLAGGPVMRVYASAETHSSVDKAVRLAGIGQKNLVKVPTDENGAMDPAAFEAAVAADKAAGMLPIGLVLCTGGTSTGAFDRITPLMEVAKAHDLYTHVDAAWAGSAMVCPEFRTLWEGVEQADSVVFNPHKWLGVSFDCSVQFLADPTAQIKTHSLRPAYLATDDHADEEITDFSEWTIPLGRRFRALKIWFVLRAYGLEGLRERIRNHVQWTQDAAAALQDDPRFEIVTEPRLGLFTFRLTPSSEHTSDITNQLLKAVNDDGRIYLTPTMVKGTPVIRFSVGQFDCTKDDVMMGVDVIRELATMLLR